MLPITNEYLNFDTRLLMPLEWASDSSNAYIFNPTICETGDGFALAYRVVLPDSEFRRLATCRLDRDLNPVPGSAVPLSDLIEFARPETLEHRGLTWHADPRFFNLGGEIFLSWNDGSALPHNHQFLLRMDGSGTRPNGLAREIITSRNRRTIEKNWMFFGAGDKVWCIYTTFPHDVMSVDMEDPDYVVCKPAHSVGAKADYETLYGVVRGGAQPIDMGETMLVLAHSSYKMTDGLRYYACMAYEISSRPPFNMTRCGGVPFTLPMGGGRADFSLTKLNPSVGGVVYPCGIVRQGDDALITYGVNDERAAVARVPLQKILDLLQPVEPLNKQSFTDPAPEAAAATVIEHHTPKLFWWDATQKSFDGKFGQRKFGIGNFGDIASRDVVERVSGVTTQRYTGEGPKLLAIGSIMHNAGNNDVIWGSGVKGSHRQLSSSIEYLDIRACRGPLSADVLRSHNLDLSKLSHVFDPGCLVAHLYAKEIAAYDPARNQDRGNIRVVPHYRDDLFFRRMYPEYINSFISVDDTPIGMIEKMIGAEAVFSSSLHGIIFAESLGIPAYWITPHGGEDTFKYYDYYYGTGRYNIKSHDDLREAIRAKALPLPKFDVQAYLGTFPHDRMADLSEFGMQAPGSYAFGSLTRADLVGLLDTDWQTLRHSAEGLIILEAIGNFRLPISRQMDHSAYVSLQIGRTKSSLNSPLRAEVRVGGEVCGMVEWEPNEPGDQTCEVYLPKGFNGRYLDLSIGCTEGRKAKLILRSASVEACRATDWLDLLDKVNRQAKQEAQLQEARALLEELPREWQMNLADLPHGPSLRRDRPGHYIRMLPKAELLVPREVLEGARLIYLTGPSATSDLALTSFSCLVDGQSIPVVATLPGDSKAWSLRCNLEHLQPFKRDVVRISFDFGKGAADPVAKESLLVRKIAFAKRG